MTRRRCSKDETDAELHVAFSRRQSDSAASTQDRQLPLRHSPLVFCMPSNTHDALLAQNTRFDLSHALLTQDKLS